MTPSEQLKEALVEKAARLIGERLDPAERPMAECLLRAAYANVAADDVVHREAEALYGAVMSMLALARHRPLGQPKLRVHRPRPDEGGWNCPHAVVEAINDDMPFLVDSLTAALHRRDLSIHFLLHPVLPVRRDAEGKLEAILSAPEAGAALESLIHIEIDRQADESLADALREVLADVRVAVEDWPSMRGRVAELCSGLAARQDAGHSAEIAEARDFLQWIHDGNFTLLGCRDFRFAANGQADGQGISVDPESGLGVLRNPEWRIFDTARDLSAMSAEFLAFLRRPDVLLLAKADRVATVHRAVPMDIIGVKRFDAAGNVLGFQAILGLFAHSAYTLSPLLIPMLRGKVRRLIERAGFRPGSHDGKTLQVILEHYPRDELLQAGEDALFDTAIGILRLQERQRVAVFLRKDEFERFITFLVFVPRERYDTRLRLKVQQVLAESCEGQISAWYTQVADSPLARLQFIVKTTPGQVPDVDLPGIERRLHDITRSWSDQLRDALIERLGEERGLACLRRWGRRFPLAYREDVSARAASYDIERMAAAADGFALHLYRPLEAAEDALRLKIYRQGQPVALSDVLPLFEHMGFRVIAELPYELRAEDAPSVWIQDFAMVERDGRAIEPDRLRAPFEDAFLAVWRGEAEDDGFNRLVVNAALSWRQVMVLRAYAKYLRQAGSTFSQSYVERSLTANPAVAALMVALFEARFDPDGPGDDADVPAEIAGALALVASADEDRILRRFLNLIDATLRTNYFQTDAGGRPKGHLALKLDSHRVDGLPLPRPMVEIFVYAPFTEGIHLRAGPVARGGIRWSDRPEDFRTETLALMKAQTMKNAVIVPVGSKGGFVVKRPPKGGGREALLEEGVRCYRTLMQGLLDLTDNLNGGQVVAPPRVVRRDGDDPYLVVAADKGTASFSDIANGVSAEYGYWLGDAFASGGSQGYDHKKMAITARGAWESVKRHFREMGRDIQGSEFTAVGVGDMSGDVFGNGMLRSPYMKLVAAFDHRHIFLDPDPEPEQAFFERQRLYDLARSSWADYDRAKLSAGGGVFPRDAKTIALSAQVRECFDIEMAELSPTELIARLLAAPVDLLWFGGIGTYVKASAESHAQVGDRANDGVRLDGRDLRCKVVGEGANLALTQNGRVEAAFAGVRLNIDAIDNSAGVDCSDHEVNIKILVDGAVADGDLTVKQRNELLARMSDEVGLLVLRDNYLQTQAISIFESQAPLMLDQQERFMRLLERAGRLDRAVEFLPGEDELARRMQAGKGLTRPEISILLAYGKMWLYDAILGSDLPDDPLLLDELVRYFPEPLRGEPWRVRMEEHRLRREIVATVSTNSMINRVGGSFVARMMERSGAAPSDLARAYLVVRDGFGLRDIWESIESLDLQVAAAVQTAMFVEVNRLIERGVGWVLSHAPRPLDIARLRNQIEPGIATLKGQLDQVLPADIAQAMLARAADYQAAGVPKDLAWRVASLIALASANDIGRIAERGGQSVERVGRLYFLVADRFSLGWLRAAAERLSGGSHWEKLAGEAVIDELYQRQAEMTAAVAAVADANGGDAEAALAAWAAERRPAVERIEQLLSELKAAGKQDLATLVVATNQFRSLIEG